MKVNFPANVKLTRKTNEETIGCNEFCYFCTDIAFLFA